MKKYGDDADQFHNQGTRVEESKRWHEQNQLRHNYSYRHVSKPKSTYKPKTSNKSTYKPDYSKTYYKPNYSNKTNRQNRKKQSRTTSYKSYNNQGYKKRQHYNSISVEEANRRIKQNKKSTSSSKSDGDNWVMALMCICGILAFAISFAIIDNPIGFFPIFIGLLGIIYVFWWAIEKISEKISSVINKKNKKDSNQLKEKRSIKQYLFYFNDKSSNEFRLSKIKCLSWVIAILSGLLFDVHICLIPNSQGIYAENLIFCFTLVAFMVGVVTFIFSSIIIEIYEKRKN